MHKKRIQTKEQRRKWNLSMRYGLSEQDYGDMLDRQKGLCALCGCPLNKPVVDHDHGTNTVRGIICHGCNIKLPAIEDAGWMMLALAYLSEAAQ